MLSSFLLHPSTIYIILHTLISTCVAIRVIMRRTPTGVALAWLLMIYAFPGIGTLAYLLIGERRIGSSRSQGISTIRNNFSEISHKTLDPQSCQIDWPHEHSSAKAMNQIGTNLIGFKTAKGNHLELFSDTTNILTAIAKDIDSANSTVLIEFYIWNEGGLADEVLNSLVRAAKRGVKCVVLIDQLGARTWWKSQQPQLLRKAGIQVLPALPVGLFRTFIGRTDLRLHRKIVVIDCNIAWTGSMNMVDPRFFKQDAGVGQWVDAMTRIQGTIVSPLACTMLSDWALESGESLLDLFQQLNIQPTSAVGSADIQVVPSGPGQSGDGLLHMILELIHSADTELILTTPYLIPDDSLLRALRGAAARGVRVQIIVPEKVDSFLTRHASRSYFDDLIDAGIQIYLYRDGLLHTKSITVDKEISMFGTVNFDMRSFWLNYEVALFAYDSSFTLQLRDLQQSYINDSTILDKSSWNVRPFTQKLLENTLRLASPLL